MNTGDVSRSTDDDARAMTARVLVLRTGQPVNQVAARTGSFAELFARGLTTRADGDDDHHARVSIDELDVTVCDVDAPLPSLTSYGGVIMTGSAAYVDDDAPWMRFGQRLLRSIVETDVPFLGVCFGHQLLGRALGADVGPNPRGREMGTVDVQLHVESIRDDRLWSTVTPSFAAQVTHRDVIRDPGPRLRVLGAAPHDPCHIVKAGPHQWGVQFHPEFDDVTMRLYLEARRDSFDADRGSGAAAARLASVRSTANAAKLLTQFARVAIERARLRSAHAAVDVDAAPAFAFGPLEPTGPR